MPMLTPGPKVTALGPCGLCGSLFSFHPDTVPSILMDPQTGLPPDVGPQPGGFGRAVAEPVCPGCVAAFARARDELGLPAAWVPA